MGATAAVEVQKPADASDIAATKDILFAKSEIIRLRKELGHLASSYGMEVATMDASDLILGEDAAADFQRCVHEISHIRRCLLLNTQARIRRGRSGRFTTLSTRVQDDELREGDSGLQSDSDSSCD